MGRDLDAVAARFAEVFEAWEIELPADDLAQRRSGYLRQANGSGSVRYAFGRDDVGEYLEFYAFHRIAGDHHARIRSTGELQPLDVLQTMYVTDPNDPEVGARSQAEMQARNEQLLRELEEAGLTAGGPVPNSFTINAYLTTRPPQSDADSAGTDG